MKTNSNNEKFHQELSVLDNKKGELEKMIISVCDQIFALGLKRIDEPLVDRYGYPRSDIDVASVTLLKSQYNSLNYEHCQLCAAISEKLSSTKEETDRGTQSGLNLLPQQPSGRNCFARVLNIMSGSPADHAGLRVNDNIVKLDFIQIGCVFPPPEWETCDSILSHSTILPFLERYLLSFRNSRVLQLEILRDYNIISVSIEHPGLFDDDPDSLLLVLQTLGFQIEGIPRLINC